MIFVVSEGIQMTCLLLIPIDNAAISVINLSPAAVPAFFAMHPTTMNLPTV
jgi:hypothetical protein